MTHPSQGDVAAQQDSMTDEELLAAVRAGDTGAYAALYRRHLGAALAQARRLVGSHDGQDVAQEAFLKVLRAITDGGGPHDRFAAYLMRVVHNEAVDRLRRTREASVDDVESVEATYSSASAAVTGGEQLDRDLVLTAFSALPQQWQRILWLTEVDGLAPREVAPQLRRSPNAVAQLSRRAREGLRTAWLQAHVDGATVRPACRQIAADLGGYERGQLSAARAERTSAHLADCVRCSVALRDLRSLSMRMRGALLPLVLESPVLLEELAEVLPLADQGAAPGAVPKAASSAEVAGAGEAGGAAHRLAWWRAAAAGAGVPVAAGVAVLVAAAGLVLVAQHPGSDFTALTPARGLASPHSVEPEPLEAEDPAATPPPTLLPAIEEEDEADDVAPEAGEPAPGTGDAADASPVPAAPPVSGADPSRAEPVATSDSSPTGDAPPTVEAPPAADALPPVEVPPSVETPPTADTPPSVQIPPTQDLVLAPGGGQGPVNGSPSEIVGEPSGKPGAPEVPDPPLLGGTSPGPPTPPPPPDPPLLGGGAPPWLPVDPTPTPEDPEVPPEDPEPLPVDPELPPEDPEVPPEAPEPEAPDAAPEAPDAQPDAPAPPVEEPMGE
ncbi:sigma-70 family RNA polymerase sigma factor [Brachybacterium sp. AOP42-C2-15]|uniref:sigma-70 family RNA polymerase sigma factor n=2 Tax=unclassified Brachybacterium TaxID=2623841 RepID=UPI0040345D96